MTVLLVIGGRSSLSAADVGGYPGAFLRVDVGARAAAMGGAFTAAGEGPAGFHYNPAGVAWVSTRTVEASLRKMSFDRRHGYVAVLFPLHDEAAIVASWVHAGVDDVYERSWPDGEKGDKIGESNNSVAFTFAKKFSSFFSLGVNLRYVQMNIADLNAYTIGFDFGIMIKIPHHSLAIGGPNGLTDLRLGLALERVNYKFPWTTGDYWVKYDEDGTSFEETWPVNLRAGLAFSVFKKKATIAFDAEVNESSGSRAHAGIEVQPHNALALRGGINGSNLTAGMGVNALWGLRTIYVDYAFVMTDDNIDDEHIVALGVRF